VPNFDLIIVGGGTMGTAAAWEAGKRGLKTLVLERFHHYHTNGAHSGETRVIRHAYAEGPDYVPLAFRADDLWIELEQATGKIIYHRVGGLEMSAPGNPHANSARESALAHDIPFEWLTPAEVRARFPQFAIGDDWVAGYGAGAGFLDVEAGMRGMANQARQSGVEIRENAVVEAVDLAALTPTVTVDGKQVTAERLIVTAGAWSGRLLADLGIPLQVLRKTLFWLEVEDESAFSEAVTPVYIAGIPGYEFYGFPHWGQPGIKVADHRGGQPTDPDDVNRSIREEEKAEIVRVARSLIPAITGKVLQATTCLYTNTPDHDFIVDRHPANGKVVIGAGFSGHGFKFAPAIGEMLVALALRERDPLPLFSLNRFADQTVPA
jgi:N-methyl-L-tryptophan oxidase